MAKIYQKRGRWGIDYAGADGKRHREFVGVSKALAREALAKKQAEAAEMKYFPNRVNNSKPFDALIDRYWELQGPNLRGRCWELMLREIRNVLGSKKAGAITPADVEEFCNVVAERASNSTANRHLSLIGAIFNRARALGEFSGENPCARVKKRKEPPHRDRYLTVGQMETFLSVVHPRLYPVVVCALLTGMRKGEIMDLAWQNVDLEFNRIRIMKSKSGKPRQVPICGKLRQVLLVLGPKKAGAVFELPNIMLRRYFEKALAVMKLEDFRFHDLRHTFASHFIMRTHDLPALQNILGHSTPAMTMRYAHVDREHLASGMAAFEAAVRLLESPGASPGDVLAQNWHKAPGAELAQA